MNEYTLNCIGIPSIILDLLLLTSAILGSWAHRSAPPKGPSTHRIRSLGLKYQASLAVAGPKVLLLLRPGTSGQVWLGGDLGARLKGSRSGLGLEGLEMFVASSRMIPFANRVSPSPLIRLGMKSKATHGEPAHQMSTQLGPFLNDSVPKHGLWLGCTLERRMSDA